MKKWKLIKKFAKKVTAQLMKRNWKKISLINEYIGKRKAYRQIETTQECWTKIKSILIPKWHKKSVLDKQRDLLSLYDYIKKIRHILQLKK